MFLNWTTKKELFVLFSHKKKGSIAEMTIKLDFNKVFEHVEWDFFLPIMNKMGFSCKWQSWIYKSIQTTTLHYQWRELLLHKSSKMFKIGRFLIADVLSRTISQAIYDGLISEIKMAWNWPIVSHIFYVDDSLFFLHADGDCNHFQSFGWIS